MLGLPSYLHWKAIITLMLGATQVICVISESVLYVTVKPHVLVKYKVENWKVLRNSVLCTQISMETLTSKANYFSVS